MGTQAPPDWRSGDQLTWDGEPNYWVPTTRGGLYDPKDLVYPTKGGNLPLATQTPPATLPAAATRGRPSMGWEPSWMQKTFHAIGTGMSKFPGLGFISKDQDNPNQSVLGTIGDSLKGGAEIGGLALGGSQLLGAAQMGVSPLGAAGAAGKGIFGLAKAHPFLTAGAVALGSKLFHHAAGTSGAGGSSGGGVSAQEVADTYGISVADATKKLEAMKVFKAQGYNADEIMQNVWPEQYAKLQAHAKQERGELVAQIGQEMNPMVAQVRQAAAQQAQALLASSKFAPAWARPLLKEYANAQQAQYGGQAAQQLMATIANAQTGGAGFQAVPAASSGGQGGGSLGDIVSLLNQQGDSGGIQAPQQTIGA